MTAPRIPPAEDHELDDEARDLLAKASISERPLNIFRTLVHHPKLFKRWLVFASHILSKSSLPARDREILILRTAWLSGSEYEWGQHVLIARREGLDDADIGRVAAGQNAEGIVARDALLVRAADELFEASRLSDKTWEALGARYDRTQVIDLVFTVGQYTMLAMALNSFGVERDAGVPGFEDTVGKTPPRG